jgi:hypothetical protein
VNNCTFEYGTYNGVKGDYVTGPNGNSIFLPFAGYRYDGLGTEGYGGYFWSGTGGSGIDVHCAFDLFCDKNYGDWNGNDRCYGQSVRPVKDK